MTAAHRVHAFLEEPIPDFIRYAVLYASGKASRRTGTPMPEVHPKQGYDLETLAYLFDVAWTITCAPPAV